MIVTGCMGFLSEALDGLFVSLWTMSNSSCASSLCVCLSVCFHSYWGKAVGHRNILWKSLTPTRKNSTCLVFVPEEGNLMQAHQLLTCFLDWWRQTVSQWMGDLGNVLKFHHQGQPNKLFPWSLFGWPSGHRGMEGTSLFLPWVPNWLIFTQSLITCGG